MEEFSRKVFRALDSIGHGPDMIRFRRKFWRYFPRHFNQTEGTEIGLSHMVVGSKAEGISSALESDIDHMFLFSDVICANSLEPFYLVENITLLQTDTSDTSPGYTKLRFIDCNGEMSVALFHEQGDLADRQVLQDNYISSEKFLSFHYKGVRSVEPHHGMIRGLSGPAMESERFYKEDCVCALHCYCPHLLENWKRRPRQYDWPSRDTLDTVASMFGQLVPVGFKGSGNQRLEWRFCFIQSELKLTLCLNETQLKLYILLKMITKDILRSVCSTISSYIMKNITYWICEFLPPFVFTEKNLLTVLVLSLRFLKLSLEKGNFLPYYMIPDRNLLAERLTPKEYHGLADILDTLIQEGPRIVLRCKKLQCILTCELQRQGILWRYKKQRNLVEKMQLFRILLDKYDSYNAEILDFLLGARLLNTVLPERRRLRNMGLSTREVDVIYRKRLSTFLS
ncbi:uncharacterized protein LOC123529017 [Mercenaria mercenaria]|uniref:uncharacterized protein LOC123529017 n=1 Tax=Mercenaria mercenaria TaxID=6596 RepID=UPI00234F6090|nr:uncharacterized protein LOC123529017 [Mercenaria mercenaria]